MNWKETGTVESGTNDAEKIRQLMESMEGKDIEELAGTEIGLDFLDLV
jgi:hypothetical protein